MYKLFVFAAVLAVAAAGVPSFGALPYPYAAAPLAYSSHYAYGAPLAYNAAPLAYNHAIAAPAVAAYAAAPVAYAAPAPVTYATGQKITYSAEPVEQHGYKIAY
ncbi:Hypothetical predicted protein [Cloeon dipterum]|uniref:Uncharacterized protein n=1 Tax=Cloeon dipterum TaxID=197152 RepID=A0A8S1DIU9_9INSE|nr:Hypothetical predicted protein [Cloeon dipterum]